MPIGFVLYKLNDFKNRIWELPPEKNKILEIFTQEGKKNITGFITINNFP